MISLYLCVYSKKKKKKSKYSNLKETILLLKEQFARCWVLFLVSNTDANLKHQSASVFHNLGLRLNNHLQYVTNYTFKAAVGHSLPRWIKWL